MRTSQAAPILIKKYGNKCTDCQAPLAHPSLPDTVIEMPGWWEFFEGEGWCKIYAQPTNMGRVRVAGDAGWVPMPGFTWAEVDHVVPKSAGGPDALHNYELVCSACNIARYRSWKAAAA